MIHGKFTCEGVTDHKSGYRSSNSDELGLRLTHLSLYPSKGDLIAIVLRFEVLYTQRGLHIKIETNDGLTCCKLNPSKSDQDPISRRLEVPYPRARNTLESLTMPFQMRLELVVSNGRR